MEAVIKYSTTWAAHPTSLSPSPSLPAMLYHATLFFLLEWHVVDNISCAMLTQVSKTGNLTFLDTDKITRMQTYSIHMYHLQSPTKCFWSLEKGPSAFPSLDHRCCCSSVIWHLQWNIIKRIFLYQILLWPKQNASEGLLQLHLNQFNVVSQLAWTWFHLRHKPL